MQARWKAKAVVGLLFAALTLTVAGCGSGNGTSTTSTTTPRQKLKVVVTTTQLSDFAHTIGGNLIDIYSVLKPNVDSHDYEPTPADITALSKADLIVKNGVGLEGWFDDAMKGLETHATVIDASRGITLRYTDQTKKEADPHIWQSPRNARAMVVTLTEALVAKDAANATTFQGNQRAYIAQIESLDRSIRQETGNLPNKKIVTNHDSIGYYAEDYGFTIVDTVIPSFDSQAELSSAHITEVVNKIKAEGVKVIFTESSLPEKSAKTIANEAGVKVVGGPDALYGDSLGRTGTTGDTYLKMLRHNTDVLVANIRG